MVMKKSRVVILLLILLLIALPMISAQAFADTQSNAAIQAVDLNSRTNAPIYKAAYSKYGKYTIPITISSGGTFLVDLVGDGEQSEVIIKDEKGKRIGPYVGTLSSATRVKTIYVQVETAGTYYLEFSTDSVKTVNTSYSVYCVPAVGIDMPTDQIYYCSGVDGKVISYYKIIAPSTGYITVDFPEQFTKSEEHYIEFLNSDMKNILTMHDKCYQTLNGTTYIGTKKGTYYIAVRSKDPAYGIKISFNSSKNDGGSTREKAQKLTKGVTKSGIMTPLEPSNFGALGDWYKFTIMKSQKVKFRIDTKYGMMSPGRSQGFALRIYRQNKKVAFVKKDLIAGTYGADISVKTAGYNGKLAPGTYYIKIAKLTNMNISGQYSLKWMK